MHPKFEQRRAEVAQARQVKKAVDACMEQEDRPIMEVLREELEKKDG